MIEIWKDIPGYEYYQASSLGRIKSLKFNKEKILSFTIGSGYKMVSLRKDNKKVKFTVHKLIFLAFGGRVSNYPYTCIDHINHDKLDNRISNLRMVTQRENYHHSLDRNKFASKYTGVSKDKNKWRASISIDGGVKILGIFDSEIEASDIYQETLRIL